MQFSKLNKIMKNQRYYIICIHRVNKKEIKYEKEKLPPKEENPSNVRLNNYMNGSCCSVNRYAHWYIIDAQFSFICNQTDTPMFSMKFHCSR